MLHTGKSLGCRRDDSRREAAITTVGRKHVGAEPAWTRSAQSRHAAVGAEPPWRKLTRSRHHSPSSLVLPRLPSRLSLLLLFGTVRFRAFLASTKPHACRVACRLANSYVTFLSKKMQSVPRNLYGICRVSLLL